MAEIENKLNQTCAKWPFDTEEQKRLVVSVLTGFAFSISLIAVFVLPFLHKRTTNNRRPAFPIPGRLLEVGRQKWMLVSLFVIAAYRLEGMLIEGKLLANMGSEIGEIEAPFSYVVDLLFCLSTALVFYPLTVAADGNTLMGFIYGTIFSVLFLGYSLFENLPCAKEELLQYWLGRLPLFIAITILTFGFIRRAVLLIIRKRNYVHPAKSNERFTLLNLEFAESYVRQMLSTTETSHTEENLNWTASFKRTVSSYKYYSYSTNIMVAVGSSTMLVLMLTVRVVTEIVISYEQYFQLLVGLIPGFSTSEWGQHVNIWQNTIFYAMLAANILAALICVIQAGLTLRNYKRCMVKVFRGKLDQLTLNANESAQSIVVNGLQYVGFQIGYAIWGFFIHAFIIFMIIFTVAALAILTIRYKQWDILLWILNKVWPILLWTVFLYIVLRLLAVFCFLHKNPRADKPRLLNIKNQRAFYNFHYVMLFISAPLGAIACLKRIVIMAVFGFINISRLDRSPMDKFNEKYDSGFDAFVSMLRLENMYSNPTMLVFLGILLRKCGNKSSIEVIPQTRLKRKCTMQWQVAYTLVNNPTLIKCRQKQRKLMKEAIFNDKFMENTDSKYPPMQNTSRF